jgi:hypothetical protein
MPRGKISECRRDVSYLLGLSLGDAEVWGGGFGEMDREYSA